MPPTARKLAAGPCTGAERSRSSKSPPPRVLAWTAAVLALVVVGTLLWRGSDAAATTSTTAAPADVPGGTPAGAVSASWEAATTATGGAARSAVDGGRVVVGDRHGVRALDVGTGVQAWRYTRANARLCDWTLAGGRVVAAFATEDRCDEAVALSVDTGVRAWTRNLDLRPDVVLSATDGVVLAASPTGVLTVDPLGNTTRWRAAPDEGCTVEDAGVGGAGVAVLQRCTDGARLRLLDGYDGTEVWTRDVAAGATLAGVEEAVVVAGDDGVQLLAAADGAPLGAPVADAAQALVGGVGATALVWAAGELLAVDADTGAVAWRTPATGLPTGAVDRALLPAGTPVPVPEGDAVVLRDLATGEELQRVDAPDLGGGGLVTVTGPVVVQQFPDRVLAHA
ncbi:Outer membrane protein assembly factor BamB, contains PQQ-like beta-propeller repeat [Geodermatophilus pulveris]|uniref:Outer membrane protein assembly factor BamB, contains PQQ-like beta-propeller repeat n=1 Tax=Geodermatophilus pulveris TaxID=1564159 RepID=A0A239B5P8_9ACTN|nr:PQQ-binding-like beta-propeller repeat protein [Geodermatophilus pulveris]SNS02534.1 Outer membrane protein assembly factor BamB, contains PQQ-like beta-propeller repeat [Geodermatophilus pulveris]